jgi:hypothetical protein
MCHVIVTSTTESSSLFIQVVHHASFVSNRHLLPIFLPTIEILFHIFDMLLDNIYAFRLSEPGVWVFGRGRNEVVGKLSPWPGPRALLDPSVGSVETGLDRSSSSSMTVEILACADSLWEDGAFGGWQCSVRTGSGPVGGLIKVSLAVMALSDKRKQEAIRTSWFC